MSTATTNVEQASVASPQNSCEGVPLEGAHRRAPAHQGAVFGNARSYAAVQSSL
jgi:hypothetical protein